MDGEQICGRTDAETGYVKGLMKKVGFTKIGKADGIPYHNEYPNLIGLAFGTNNPLKFTLPGKTSITIEKSGGEVPRKLLFQLKTKIPDVIFYDAQSKEINLD